MRIATPGPDTHSLSALPCVFCYRASPGDIPDLPGNLLVALDCGTGAVQLRRRSGHQRDHAGVPPERRQNPAPFLHHPFLFPEVLFPALFGALSCLLGSFPLLLTPPARCTSPGCFSRCPQQPRGSWCVCTHSGSSLEDRCPSCPSLAAALTPGQSF